MKRNNKLFLLLLVFLAFKLNGYGQVSAPNPSDPFEQVLSEIDQLLSQNKLKLKENENEILRNQITIQKSKLLKEQAKQSNNTEAADIATKAESTAQEAYDKNVENKSKLNSIIAKLELIKKKVSDAIEFVQKNKETKAVAMFCYGSVSITTSSGTKTGCASNLILKPGDVIKTGKESGMLLTMSNGSKLKLNENTELKIPEAGVTDEVLNILYGSTRAWVKKFSKKFEVRCPSAVTSVRGTNFETFYTKEGEFTTILYEGEIEIENLITKEKILLKPGQKITIDKKGVTTGPVEFDNKTIKQWWED